VAPSAVRGVGLATGKSAT